MVGAFMATKCCNLLHEDARKSLNRIVFMVFTPSLAFACLARSVSFQDIILWWFLPVNIGLTFMIRGVLGWIPVKLLEPSPHLEGIVITMCSAGNLGNLLLIIVPAICEEDGSPFGNKSTCTTVGRSYASFSMALAGFFIWTYTFYLVQTSCKRYKVLQAEDASKLLPNTDFDINVASSLLQESSSQATSESSIFSKAGGFLHLILEQLMTPPNVAADTGFRFRGCYVVEESHHWRHVLLSEWFKNPSNYSGTRPMKLRISPYAA